MKSNDFAEGVTQALDTGFWEIWLTPMLGEVFADPDWRTKFDHLENRDGVKSFGFFTNFIMPSPKDISVIFGFQKLSSIHISIYGHDPESFTKIARKPPMQFDRLMANLRALEDVIQNLDSIPDVHFSIRTYGDMSEEDLPQSELVELLFRLRNGRNVTLMVSETYDNWGGTISDDDVKEIGTHLTDGRGVYMYGACSVLFSTPQISADGNVRACACRDVDGSLTLGNLADAPLKDLHSWSNPKFRDIVEGQQKGRFTENCRSCSMYRSIYDDRSSGEDGRWETISLSQAIKQIR